MEKKSTVAKSRPEAGASPPKSRSGRSQRKSRYTLYEQLGQGGMGTVFRALDKELNRTIAVKVLHPELVPNLGHLLRLKRELVLASRVQSRYVVRVHDVGEFEGRPLIAMEFIDGESMDRMLRRTGRLPPSQALAIAIDICRGLRDIHSANIVHRDLKPGNILVDKLGQVHVSDFGLACSTVTGEWNLTRSGPSWGTPLYTAPEQSAGLPVDARCDLYSFGLLLLEMVTGTTALEVLDSIRDRLVDSQGEKHVRTGDIRNLARLDRVIRGCLQLNRNARLSSAEEVLQLLDPTIPEAESTGVPSAFVMPGMAIPTRRVRVLVGLTAASLVSTFLWLSAHHFPGLRRAIDEQIPKVSKPPQTEIPTLISSDSSVDDLQRAVKSLASNAALEPRNVSAQRVYIEALIKIYEKTHSAVWLGDGRRALYNAQQAGMPEADSLLFGARLDVDAGDDRGAIRKLSGQPDLLRFSERANLLLGRAYEDSGESGKALSYYHEALRINPESWRGANALGSVLIELNHLPEALTQFSRMIALNPSDSAGYSNLGTTLLRLGRIREARSSFEQALQKTESGEAYNNLGVAAYYQREYGTSVPFFEAALRIRPDADGYLAGLGDALRHNGRSSQARAAYGEALRALDKSAGARSLRPEEQARRGRCLAWLGDETGAASVMSVAAAQYPTNHAVLYTLAIIAIIEGRRNAAEAALQQAVRNGYPAALLRQDPDIGELARLTH